MKLHHVIFTAYYDLVCKKRFFMTMIRCLTFLMTMLLVTNVISDSIMRYYHNEIHGKLAHYCISCKLDDPSAYVEQTDISAINSISGLQAPIYSAIADVPESSGHSKEQQITLDRVSLRTDTAEFAGTDDRTFTFPGNVKKHLILGVQIFLPKSGDLISIPEQEAFEFYYPNESLLIAGRLPNQENEIMLSDFLLAHFGIQNLEELVGKHISLDIDGTPYLEDKLLTGVICSDFFRLRYGDELENDIIAQTGRFTSQVWLVAKESELNSLKIKSVSVFWYPEDLSFFPNIIHTLTEKGVTNVSYSQSSANEYLLISNIRTLSAYFLVLLAGAVVITMGLMIVQAVLADIRRQNPYFSMLGAIGYRKCVIAEILLIEHFVVVLISAVVSIIFIFGISTCFNLVMKHILDTGLEVTMLQFWSVFVKIIPITSASYLLLITAIFCGFTKRW